MGRNIGPVLVMAGIVVVVVILVWVVLPLMQTQLVRIWLQPGGAAREARSFIGFLRFTKRIVTTPRPCKQRRT